MTHMFMHVKIPVKYKQTNKLEADLRAAYAGVILGVEVTFGLATFISTYCTTAC